MSDLFNDATRRLSWDEAVRQIKSKQVLIMDALRRADYDILSPGEGEGHFIRQAQQVQAAVQRDKAQILQQMIRVHEAAQLTASSVTDTMQLLPSAPPAPPGQELQSLFSNPQQFQLAREVGQSGLGLLMRVMMAAVIGQGAEQHSNSVQLHGLTMQQLGMQASLMAAVVASNNALASAVTSMASAFDRQSDFVGLMGEEVHQLSLRPAPVMQTMQGTMPGQGQLQPVAPHFKDLAEVAAQRSAKRRRVEKLRRGRSELITTAQATAEDYPNQPSDLPEGYTWVVMQHVQDGGFQTLGVKVCFQLDPLWTIPGRLLPGQLSPTTPQWTSNSWQGAKWVGRTIQVNTDMSVKLHASYN